MRTTSPCFIEPNSISIYAVAYCIQVAAASIDESPLGVLAMVAAGSTDQVTIGAVFGYRESGHTRRAIARLQICDIGGDFFDDTGGFITDERGQNGSLDILPVAKQDLRAG